MSNEGINTPEKFDRNAFLKLKMLQVHYDRFLTPMAFQVPANEEIEQQAREKQKEINEKILEMEKFLSDEEKQNMKERARKMYDDCGELYGKKYPYWKTDDRMSFETFMDLFEVGGEEKDK